MTKLEMSKLKENGKKVIDDCLYTHKAYSMSNENTIWT